MPIDGLLGVLLVCRRSSLPPEVIFQHPPPPAALKTAKRQSRAFAATTGTRRALSSHSRNQEVFDNGVDRKCGEGVEARRQVYGTNVGDVWTQWATFGVNSVELANLLLPEDELCNQGFELEIDAGPRMLCGFHVGDVCEYTHLRFVCFPCAIERDFMPAGCTSSTPGRSVEEIVEK
eukprot:GHVS01031698.1.p1 GENE.GHVS01031698.1~~GHVS01031698.1.p1  ORF type:complete len:177 (-),score=26.97 GHVS01031698.1:163-693(-)